MNEGTQQDFSAPSAELNPPQATQSYAVSAIPEPYRILGLRLKPFSLGHYLLMQRFGCRFIVGDATTAERNDLLLGVLICSMNHADFLAFIEQPDFLKEVQKWGKSVSLFDFPEKSKLFQRYLRESLTEPEFIETNPQESSGDWAQNLKMTLVTRLNYSEPAAMDMPVSKALAEYYSLAESEGTLRMITAEDKAMALANEKAMAEYNAAKEAQPCPA